MKKIRIESLIEMETVFVEMVILKHLNKMILLRMIHFNFKESAKNVMKIVLISVNLIKTIVIKISR
jgi:hypothetical protein